MGLSDMLSMRGSYRKAWKSVSSIAECVTSTRSPMNLAATSMSKTALCISTGPYWLAKRSRTSEIPAERLPRSLSGCPQPRYSARPLG